MGSKRAAKQLELTQSAVSQTVSRMERRIGTQLLERTTPPRPTAAGQRVLEFAHNVFDGVQTLERDLADIQGQSTGRVRLGASEMVTTRHLHDLLARFSRKHQRVSFDVANVPSRELVLLVREGGCELGFGPFQQQMRGFTQHPYFVQRMRLYAGQRHPQFDALRKGNDEGLKQSVLLTSYLDPVENRPSPRRLRYRFASVWQVASLDLRVHLMQRGVGIGYLPEDLVRTHPLGKQLKPVARFDHGTVERQIGLYYRRDRTLSSLARLFVEFCDTRFRKRRS